MSPTPKQQTPKQLGMRLKTLRERKQLSQAALAAKAGITREYVNKLEAGRYDPTVGVLQCLAKAFGVRAAKLLDPLPRRASDRQ